MDSKWYVIKTEMSAMCQPEGRAFAFIRSVVPSVINRQLVAKLWSVCTLFYG